ncbi:MAG: GNAT family N-acetyltransferase [Alphaproteobacteria bacterium]|nr:GNAT family N-acetyltransferase [Alphaproteobacteria bacterium]
MVRAAPDPEDPHRAWLISMWVAPVARGSGASDRLVRAVIEHARRSGREALLLDVGDHAPRAIALYARHGFEPEGWRGPMPPPRAHLSEHRRILMIR